MIDYIWRINNFDVYYTNETNGGGDYLALEYIDVIKEWHGTVDNMLEWCSGPGFIGYGMLASNICKNISFNDMYAPAIEMLERTRDNSNFISNISIYKGHTLESIPLTQKYNIVVGNPPHWKDAESATKCLGFNIKEHKHIENILVDADWKSHKQFYKLIKPLLHPQGQIILQENAQGSCPDDFKEIVDQAGLKISSYAQSKMYNDIYYLIVEHK